MVTYTLANDCVQIHLIYNTNTGPYRKKTSPVWQGDPIIPSRRASPLIVFFFIAIFLLDCLNLIVRLCCGPLIRYVSRLRFLSALRSGPSHPSATRLLRGRRRRNFSFASLETTFVASDLSTMSRTLPKKNNPLILSDASPPCKFPDPARCRATAHATRVRPVINGPRCLDCPIANHYPS